jgi:excisionase family DNA binding protein
MKDPALHTDSLPDWLSPLEVQRYLRLSRTSVYDLLRSGAIQHQRFGRSIRIPKSALAPTVRPEVAR